MRRLTLLTIVLLSAFSPMLRAQSIKIHFKDGTTVVYPTANVEKITTIASDNGYISGTWYLGYWVSGSTSIHFDGSENMTFSGYNMTWAGRQDGSSIYTIAYSNDLVQFTATNKSNSSDVQTWEIVTYTDDLLVLRNGGADRYFYTTASAAASATLDVEDDVSDILAKAGGYTKSTVTPMGKHFENRHQTTDSDRAWLANASNEPDVVAGLSKWEAKSVNLYPYGSPSPADINQHAIGDCSLCSVLASMAYRSPDFIKSILKDNGNNTYTVSMFDPQGNKVSVSVSNKILCDGNGNIGQLTGKNNVVTWATILEKAAIKWEKCYGVDGIEGIGTEFAAPLFTGCGESFAFGADVLSTEELKRVINWALKKGMISIGGFNKGDLQCGTLKSVTNHAFAFMLSNNSSSVFAMRNPWGIESVDGVLEIPDDRNIVKTIDARLVYPGAAEPYVKSDLSSYTPPKFTARKTDLGVSPRLLKKMKSLTNPKELW